MSQIGSFLGERPLKCLFVPYAAVTFSFDEYEQKVKEKFQTLGHELASIHRGNSPLRALASAEVLVIGGGNTFHLLKLLQENNLIDPIRSRVKSGIPYIGWSAGSNVACPTISTTNDMPIIQPKSFEALNLVPFQINPHYTDLVPNGHNGETRDQRIEEFLTVNPSRFVVGLREGTMLRFENNMLSLLGNKPAKLFRHNAMPYELETSRDFSFLIGND